MGKKRDPIELAPPPRHYIKEWRNFRDLSQEQVGERLGVGPSHISQIELNTINYTRETLNAIAVVLGCTPGELLDRDPRKPLTELLRIIDNLSPGQISQAVRILNALADRAA